MMEIRSQADLDRANIQVAWSMAPKMTDEQYAQLCRVTVEQWRNESEGLGLSGRSGLFGLSGQRDRTDQRAGVAQ